MQFAVAANVIGVVITLSPFFRPKASADRCNPDVALFTATAYSDSVYFLLTRVLDMKSY